MKNYIKIRDNGSTYTVSYYENNKIVWCENEIAERSARSYTNYLPKENETLIIEGEQK